MCATLVPIKQIPECAWTVEGLTAMTWWFGAEFGHYRLEAELPINYMLIAVCNLRYKPEM